MAGQRVTMTQAAAHQLPDVYRRRRQVRMILINDNALSLYPVIQNRNDSLFMTNSNVTVAVYT